MDMVALFWLLGKLSRTTYGMGKANKATSTRMLGMEMAKRNFIESTSQDASTLLSQKPRAGMHCNTTRSIYTHSRPVNM